MRVTHLVILLLVGAALGLAVFGVLVNRATTGESIDHEEWPERMAALRLEAERAGEAGQTPQTLNVAIYRAASEELTRTRIPVWFIRLKGPALKFFLRGSDVNLDRLGLTAGEIEKRGPGIIVDESRTNGDHVLIWAD